MKFKRQVTILAGAAALALLVTSCSSPQSDADAEGPADKSNLVIAAPMAITGPVGSVGLEVKEGAELAIAQVNAEGGIDGRKLELKLQDTAGEPSQAVQVATSFIKDPDVVALLGPLLTPEVAAVYPLTTTNKIVMIPPASIGVIPGAEDGNFNEWTFRINQPAAPIATPLVDAAIERTDAKKVTVLHIDNNPTYVEIAQSWIAAAEEAGVEVQEIGFPSTTTDFSSIVTSIDPDADLLALGMLPANVAAMVSAARQAGVDAPVMGETTLLGAEVWAGSRGGVEGGLAYSVFLAEANDASKQFTEDFKAEYDKEPTLFNALAFDSVKMIAASLKGEPTRDNVRKGLSALSEYPGTTGTISYDGSGDVLRKDVPLVEIGADGVPEKVGTLELESSGK